RGAGRVKTVQTSVGFNHSLLRFKRRMQIRKPPCNLRVLFENRLLRQEKIPPSEPTAKIFLVVKNKVRHARLTACPYLQPLFANAKGRRLMRTVRQLPQN
ncbi:MAG TPA: hypothetical protein VGB94_02615, partial [Acidobacteriaceae bacterium]